MESRLPFDRKYLNFQTSKNLESKFERIKIERQKKRGIQRRQRFVFSIEIEKIKFPLYFRHFCYFFCWEKVDLSGKTSTIIKLQT